MLLFVHIVYCNDELTHCVCGDPSALIWMSVYISDTVVRWTDCWIEASSFWHVVVYADNCKHADESASLIVADWHSLLTKGCNLYTPLILGKHVHEPCTTSVTGQEDRQGVSLWSPLVIHLSPHLAPRWGKVGEQLRRDTRRVGP